MVGHLITIEALQLFDNLQATRCDSIMVVCWKKSLCTNSLIAKTEIDVCHGCRLIQLME